LANAWKKPRYLGDEAWLCIVTGVKAEVPESHRIQNPAAQFRLEDIQATGYVIREAAWRNRIAQRPIGEVTQCN